MEKPPNLSGPWLPDLCCKEAALQGLPTITLSISSLILSFQFDEAFVRISSGPPG